MSELVFETVSFIAASAIDVLPIAVFLFGFHWLVVGGPLPGARAIVTGFGFVVFGLGLFLLGLEQSLFPLGRLMAEQLTNPAFLGLVADGASAHWSAYYWVYLFAAAIGFSTTMAEPSLIAVSLKANTVSGGAINAFGLRVAVAIGVGFGVCLGCYRIVTGLPLHWFIAVGYFIVIAQTLLAPKSIAPLAYDSGGVTTSTVTVPVVTALGLGLADSIPGRNPLLDGFGLVAFASLFPIISVLGYGQLAARLTKESGKEKRE